MQNFVCDCSFNLTPTRAERGSGSQRCFFLYSDPPGDHRLKTITKMKTSNSKLPKIKRESLGQPGLHCCSPREVPDQWHQHHQGLVRSRNSWAQATLAESDSLMWGPEVWVLTNAPSDSDDMKSWELLVWRKVHTPWSDNTLGFNPSSDTYAYSIFSFTELFSVLALSSIHQR